MAKEKNQKELQQMMRDLPKYIEKSTLLLEKPLKAGIDFIIDLPSDQHTFNSYKNKYGELKGAVYIFYLNECIRFSGNRFFKIGRVSPKSTARFDGHHYNPKSSGSNLARSILNNKPLGKEIGDVGDFIRNNFIRINILFLKSAPEFSNELVEAILHYKYNPLFEGPISQRKE